MAQRLLIAGARRDPKSPREKESTVKNPITEKNASVNSSKLRLAKETLKGLSIRTGVRAGARAAYSVSDGAGGSCPRVAG